METCICANFTSNKSRIALQVARKIAPCDRALIHVCLAYLFLQSGQVLSSFKCYFKRKYLITFSFFYHRDDQNDDVTMVKKTKYVV